MARRNSFLTGKNLQQLFEVCWIKTIWKGRLEQDTKRSGERRRAKLNKLINRSALNSMSVKIKGLMKLHLSVSVNKYRSPEQQRILTETGSFPNKSSESDVAVTHLLASPMSHHQLRWATPAVFLIDIYIYYILHITTRIENNHHSLQSVITLSDSLSADSCPHFM